jgi:polysaccharide export outer membrane protein
MAESENQDGRMNSLKFIKKELVFLTLLVAMVSLLSGWSGCIPKDRPTVLPPSALQATDTLQVNDVVTVIISNIPKPPDPHQERIREDGTITLPLVGQYEAQGKTQSQVQKELTELYDKYYRGHVVTVSSEARYFYVTGEVKMPGKAAYIPSMTFSRAIAVAGGYSTFASKTRVRVTSADGKYSRRVNARDIEKDSSKDFPIMPGDIIDVPKR